MLSRMSKPVGDPFACPNCHAPLVRRDDRLSCGTCGDVAALRADYADFIGHLSDRSIEGAELDYAWDWRGDERITPVVTAGWRLLVEEHDRALRTLLPRTSRYVAVGAAGENWFASCLSNRVSQYVVIDASAAQLVKTRTPKGAKPLLARGLGEHLPVVSDWADVVELQSVLDHAVDPLAMLREARRVVRPDGLVTVTLSNDASWYRRWARIARIAGPPDHAHAHWFDPEALRVLLRTAGLEPVRMRTVSYLRLPTTLERRLAQWGSPRVEALVRRWDRGLRLIFGEDAGGMMMAAAKPSSSGEDPSTSGRSDASESVEL